ncbi:MAG: histidinol-phosphate aminotransferase family protein [Chloroflexi bacterium]|nr:histidinol-phosphate aminotransferase family protein [Chloroflexota bacterium]
MTLLRPDLLDLPEVPHGSLAASEARGRPGILDLSANLSPLGVPPAVREAVARAPLEAYPEPDALPLREAIAARLGLSVAHVVAGNGAVDLIWRAALVALRPGQQGLVVGPTFGEYARAVRVAGGEPLEVRAQPPDFAPPLAEVMAALRAAPAVLFLCNPNNPTGTLLPAEAIAQLLNAAPETLVVVDEAYQQFSAGPDLLPLLGRENLVLVRSLTKTYAMPGVRVGYALASPPVAAALRRVAPPWSVSAPAIAAGLAALALPEWEEASQRLARRGLECLMAGLRARGLAPLPSAANFLLVAVPAATRVRQQLLERGVLVRDCTSFGLPGYLRIAAGPPAAIERLLAVWPECE